jgi:hypothetical protein
MAKTAKSKKKKGSSRLGLAGLYIASLILMVVLKGIFIFILIALAPTIVARIADTSKHKEIYRCVLACNLAGIMPYLSSLLQTSIDDSMRLLSDPECWFVIYAFSGIGWILVWVTPFAAELLTEMGHSSRINRLEAMQHKLVEEWGPEIQRKIDLV